jgi:hypothetical protein
MVPLKLATGLFPATRFGCVTNKRTLHSGDDPKALAVTLLRAKVGKRKSDFNCPLHYPQMRY